MRFIPTVALLLGALALPSAALANGTQPPAGDDNNDKVTICHLPPGNPENAQTITVGASAVAAHLAHGDSLGACPGGDHADHPTRPCRPRPHSDNPSNNSGPYRAEDCPDADVVCPVGTHRQEMEQVKLHGRAAKAHRWSNWYRVANDDDDGDDDHGDDDNDHGRHGHNDDNKHRVVCVPNDNPPGPPAVVPPVVNNPTPVAAPVAVPAPVVTNITAPQQTPAQKKAAQKRKAARKRATQRARKRAAQRPQLTG